MTIQETAKIISVIRQFYPRFTDGRDPETFTALWQRLFRNDDYQVVGHALEVYLATDTRGFPPAPGQLREIMADMQTADTLEPSEAWAMVYKAICNGAYHSRTEFENLPEDIQRAIGSPEMIHEWALMDIETVQSVVASNFQRTYRARTEKAKQALRLPDGLRAALPGLDRIGKLPETPRYTTEPMTTENPAFLMTMKPNE